MGLRGETEFDISSYTRGEIELVGLIREPGLILPTIYKRLIGITNEAKFYITFNSVYYNKPV
jgi:hypothetical protein